MQECFHPSAKHLLYKYIAPSFVDILFVLEVKLIAFLPMHRCALSFNLKYILVSLCKYSRTLRLKLLTWWRVVSQAGLFGSGRARA